MELKEKRGEEGREGNGAKREERRGGKGREGS